MLPLRRHGLKVVQSKTPMVFGHGGFLLIDGVPGKIVDGDPYIQNTQAKKTRSLGSGLIHPWEGGGDGENYNETRLLGQIPICNIGYDVFI